jgi:hypothetical protein
MTRTPKNPNVDRLAGMPFDKDTVSPMPQIVPRAAAGTARRELHMGMPGPARDKAEGDRDKVSPDVERASRVSESSTANAQDLPDVSAPPPGEAPRADIHDLPRNEAFRHGVVGLSDTGVDEWRESERRFGPGIEDVRDDATPVRGPSTGASTGRVVTERETVADDEADADATDRNAARQDDPDRA